MFIDYNFQEFFCRLCMTFSQIERPLSVYRGFRA
jgi:hypothetical protein